MKYIKQNIIMTVLSKTNFHLVDICRLIKNQSCKKISRRKKLIQTFTFFLSCRIAHEVLRRSNVMHTFKILLTLKNII